MKNILAIILSVLSLAATGIVTAQNQPVDHIVIKTNQGDITVALDASRAPQTVANFLRYVDEGRYKQTLFHRVIKDFMIQGGGFNEQFQKQPTFAAVNNEADNGLKNIRGSIAMARTSAPHSATNQFFINTADNTSLDHRGKTFRDWGYTVFGQVVAGMEVVDKISQLPTGRGGPFPRDVPRQPVIILDIVRDTGAQ